jgi:hypothetical protein
MEVILAIAVLGGALATIGELIRIGARNAAIARDLTTAQLYCESRMSEVAAGAVDLGTLGTEPLDEEGEWLCAIETAEQEQQELIGVTVTVGQNPDMFPRPVSFTLTRWIIDPEYAAECAALDAQLKAEAKQRVANAKQTAGGGGGGTPVDSGQGGGQGAGGFQGFDGGIGGGQGGFPGAPGGGQDGFPGGGFPGGGGDGAGGRGGFPGGGPGGDAPGGRGGDGGSGRGGGRGGGGRGGVGGGVGGGGGGNQGGGRGR